MARKTRWANSHRSPSAISIRRLVRRLGADASPLPRAVRPGMAATSAELTPNESASTANGIQTGHRE
jgi:hypothetical protein